MAFLKPGAGIGGQFIAGPDEHNLLRVSAAGGSGIVFSAIVKPKVYGGKTVFTATYPQFTSAQCLL